MNAEDIIFPFKHIALSKAQLREFLYRLAGNEGCQFSAVGFRCGGHKYLFSKRILRLMDVPEREQEKLLELCEEQGGYCDCEILMNAASFLLGEETPW